MFSAEKLPKSLRFSGSIDESETERMPEPMPPAEPTTCDAAGTCSFAYVRFVTPQLMNDCVSGLYELDGQSIDSNGCVTYCVVSYGVKWHEIAYGLPSGAVRPCQRSGLVQRRPPPGSAHGVVVPLTMHCEVFVSGWS